MTKQELGPIQKQWVESLRSGEFKQGMRRLINDDRYCCLGVACVVAERNGIELPPWKTYAILPEEVIQRMNFRGAHGDLYGSRHIPGGDECSALTVANDRGSTFKQIADYIERHPELVFRAPA